ncbi:phosphotransferase [Pseudactinotalea sp. HY160]|uniref:phosphotransferase family protein n=1 Tax=Pseudactinotalea sp. HY160 TaxID=2654490 RepID=UPI00128E0400|nr:aminoglycoside phosphotransferase family protein [Pseudactinotalea sp. HY160]MPV49268.1 phosphotransferase [Pseudactinotalea sp. HY160]
MRPQRNEPTRALLEAIAGALQGSLQSWRATVSEPARGGEVKGFDLEVTTAAGATVKHTVFVETDPEPGKREGVFRVTDPSTGQTVAVWLYPKDPALPALEATVFRSAAQRLLARIGIDVDQPHLKVVSYRPGRRAVIRVDAAPTPVFLKVVRPGRAEPLVARHQAFKDAGVLVPRVLGWSDDGLLALAALPGVEAQSICGELPDTFIAQVSALVQRIATVPSQERARRSLVERVDWYVDHVSQALPEYASHIEALGVRIDRLLARGRSAPVPEVTIHADLHVGQIFVDPADPGAITGVLDIDTAGSGDPADDAAALFAHLLVLGRHLDHSDRAPAAARVRELAVAWRGTWARPADPGFPDRVVAITATHLLGHAIRQADTAGTTDLFLAAHGLVSEHEQSPAVHA